MAVLNLAACSSGPADIASGTYRAFAAAPELGATPNGQMDVAGTAVTIATDDGATTRTATSDDREFVVCPPDTHGTTSTLGTQVTLGTTGFTEPALIGDCGQTKPERITLVDLASAEAGSPFPFTRWIEFCKVTDPDC